MKSIVDIEDKQLIHAVSKMCRELDISGSICGGYNLYTSTIREKHKMLEEMKRAKEVNEHYTKLSKEVYK